MGIGIDIDNRYRYRCRYTDIQTDAETEKAI